MRDGNKGNLQYLAGELINSWGFANLQADGDSGILDKGVFTLDAIAYPVTRNDPQFKAAWDKVSQDRVKMRYEQMRLLIAALYDKGILSDKGVPFYDSGDEDDDGDKQ